jgi:hypothetical protein
LLTGYLYYGAYSRNFALDQGRAQGDNISPNTFNFADQILIYKIELDPVVNGIWKNFIIPPDFPAEQSPFFMHESLGETAKNESLADDNTTLILLEESNLRSLRLILDDFGKISGLLCNYDKTMVMPIGRNDVPTGDICGFTVSDKIKLLGMEITSALDNTDDIFIDIGEKILNIILFWSRFRLSLCGRIAIIKTLIIPRLNYLGCILTPSRLVLDNIQDLIDDFALDGLRINKARYYLPPCEGGLGLIHVGTFLMAQKCSWVKRTQAFTIDNWRLRLKLGCPNFDVSLLKKCDFDSICTPILFNIAEAYEIFLNCYSKIGNNHNVVPIFSNSSITRSRDDRRLIDIDFFGKKFYNENKNIIRKLTVPDCFSGANFKSIPEFANDGLVLTVSLWMRLRSALLLYKNSLQPLPVSDEQPMPVIQFLSRIKRGSKPFRSVIDKSIYQDQAVTDLPVLISFCKIVDLQVPSVDIAKNFLSSWNQVFLGNDLREFIFKCRNNLLKTGDRLSHILVNVDDRCFLCKNLYPEAGNRETFMHLFRKCNIVSNLILRFNVHFGIVWNEPDLDFDRVYWFGDLNGNLERGSLLLYDLFRYQIWLMKLRRILNFELLITNVTDMLRTIFAIKPALRTTFIHNKTLATVARATG